MVIVFGLWQLGQGGCACVFDLVFDFLSFAHPSRFDFIPGFFVRRVIFEMTPPVVFSRSKQNVPVTDECEQFVFV